MHYLIDGYNLLFQTAFLTSKKNLHDARMALISELDRHAHLQHVHLTLVFDAAFQDDDCRRCHFQSLEIIYTGSGQTADDYLVAHTTQATSKHKITIVTSDKRLARRLIAPHVQVEAVRDFLMRIRKKSIKKAPFIEKPAVKKLEAPPKPLPTTLQTFDPKKLPPLSDIDAWEAIFLFNSPMPSMQGPA